MIKAIKTYYLLLLVFGSFYCTSSYAQTNSFTQFFTNLPVENAAFTGVEEALYSTLGFRQQWNNFGGDNRVIFVSVFGELGGDAPDSFKKNSLRVSDPSLYDELSTNKKIRRKHGLGGSISLEEIGPFRSINITLNHAYHIPISKRLNFSFGTSVALNNQEIDFSDFEVRDEVNDQFFQELMNANSGRQNSIDINFGASIHSKSFYLGVSTDRLVTEQISGDELLENDVFRRFSMILGNNFRLNQNFELFPNARFGYSELSDVDWNVGMRLRYKETFYIGASYEYDIKTSFLIGFSGKGRFSINYAYDQFTSDLRNFNTGNHEVLASFILFNKYSRSTRFW
ncbi:MAG: PorP/SprF family type IX secretion system membrane protein [Bacteroidota bacterium]